MMPGQELEQMLQGRIRLTRIMEEIRFNRQRMGRDPTDGKALIESFRLADELVRELAYTLPGFEDIR